MPDVPAETATEEEYVDEHGRTVVKKVLARARGPPQTRPPAPAPGPVAQGRGVPAISSRSPGKSSGGTCPLTAPRRKR